MPHLPCVNVTLYHATNSNHRLCIQYIATFSFCQDLFC
nr:MAG TPA: hypothetical protein [Caudoviricetes sp.]